MSDKPGKPKDRPDTEPEREEHPPRSESTKGAPQKKKPGDAARKMREMFKGGG